MLTQNEKITNGSPIIDKFGFLFLIPMYVIMAFITLGIMIPILSLSGIITGFTP